MYSLIHKVENAHEDGIWTCAWANSIEPEDPSRLRLSQSEDHEFMQQENIHSYIVTGSLDDSVKVWEYANERLSLKHKLAGHSLGVVSVAVNSDGTRCASSSLDSSLRIWNISSGEKLSSIEVGPVDIWSIVFSSDDKYIVSGSHAGKIRLYDSESGAQEKVLDTRGGKFILSVACSPDGKYIASGAIDGIINIFDVIQGKVLQTLEGHAMPIRSLCFSPDSQLLLTSSDDGHMKIYDIKDANVAGTVSGHASWVLGASFSHDGTKFASCSSDNSVKIFELSKRQCLHTFKEHTDQVWAVKYHPSEKDTIVSVSEDKAVNIYKSFE